MQNRTLSLIAFVFVVAASFYLGTFVNGGFSVDSDDTLGEVYDLLLDNHFTQPDEEDLIKGAIEGMIASLDDPYTTYFDDEEYTSFQSGFGENYVGVGVTVSSQNNLVVVEAVKDNGPAKIAGVRVDDIIVEVDGVNVENSDFYEVLTLVGGEEGTDVTLGLYRQGNDEIIRLTMTRTTIINSTVIYGSYTSTDGNLIGYIKVTTFGDETSNLFSTAIEELELEGIEGLIVDLRGNGGGHLHTVYNMLNEFLVDNGQEMFSTEAYENGVFKREEYHATNTERKTYEIVTLVNGNSASASEVFASAMQEQGDYQVIGTTTFGKGTMQIDASLSSTEADSVHLTIGKWITAEGNWVHYDGGTGGVVPNIISERSIYENAYSLFLFDGEELVIDTVDSRIKNLQIILNIMGYDIREDGYFDQETKDAIIDIQASNALITDGNVDNDTLEFINTALNEFQDNNLNDIQLQACLTYFDEFLTVE